MQYLMHVLFKAGVEMLCISKQALDALKDAALHEKSGRVT